jgi:hypothetical protein
MSRSCDGCTYCCTIFKIDEINKPLDTPCQHLVDGKCCMYEARPVTCKRFNCAWVKGELPFWAFPPDIKLMPMLVGAELLLYEPPSEPDAWQKTEYLAKIKKLTNKYVVSIINQGSKTCRTFLQIPGGKLRLVPRVLGNSTMPLPLSYSITSGEKEKSTKPIATSPAPSSSDCLNSTDEK